MEYNFNQEAKLFMVFDILGDTVRTGPLLWRVKRERLEDVKNHTLDLLLMVRLLKQYLPEHLDYDKITDYIICHDLPEAITGDITKFQGVSGDEINRVTGLAIDYLSDQFDGVFDFSTIFHNYENKTDIESKTVHMFDKLHSSTTVLKYQSEENIDANDPEIIPILRNHPEVVKGISEGKDVGDIFFDFHIRAVHITDEECIRYDISRDEANQIVEVIQSFGHELYQQKKNGTLLNGKDNFPVEAMKYNVKM